MRRAPALQQLSKKWQMKDQEKKEHDSFVTFLC
jgi:hypothetical protein